MGLRPATDLSPWRWGGRFRFRARKFLLLSHRPPPGGAVELPRRKGTHHTTQIQSRTHVRRALTHRGYAVQAYPSLKGCLPLLPGISLVPSEGNLTLPCKVGLNPLHRLTPHPLSHVSPAYFPSFREAPLWGPSQRPAGFPSRQRVDSTEWPLSSRLRDRVPGPGSLRAGVRKRSSLFVGREHHRRRASVTATQVVPTHAKKVPYHAQGSDCPDLAFLGFLPGNGYLDDT